MIDFNDSESFSKINGLMEENNEFDEDYWNTK